MKIRVTFDLDERCRRAIDHQYHSFKDSRPASREDCQIWIDMVVDATLQDICVEYDRCVEAEEMKARGEVDQ
jgi:hypothetical protein